MASEAKTKPDGPETVTSILNRYENDPAFLIPMMQDLQEEAGYLPKDGLRQIAEALDVPVTRVYSVATFYSSFSMAPRGAHLITLCMGTVCYLKGADKVAESIQEAIGCGSGETSPDGRFTFQPVNCLGACALAPVMVIDGTYYDKVSPDQIPDILAKYAAPGEEAAS